MKTEHTATDGIAAAFEIIMDEIQTEADKIAERGTAAFKTRDYSEAQKLGDVGHRLDEFRKKVDTLLSEWQAGIDVTYRRNFSIKALPESKQTKRRKNTKLRVRFADGPEIEEYFAADTFALAIKELGIDRIEKLGYLDNGEPLISPRMHPTYQHRKFGDKYLSTHSSTERKKDMIEQIAKQLGRKVTVTVIQP
ncbi:MAG: hypothetical protein M3Y82_13720 [Verrucomicrobiota bacterium]|nr:hypothetical protein [Verrucomicrobiota bacterium]